MAAAMLVVAACGGDDGDSSSDGSPVVDDAARESLAPSFGSSTTAVAGEGGASTPAVDGSTPTTSTSAVVPGAADEPLSSQVDDHAGDVQGVAPGAPAWSDLLGARITRSRSGFELRVRLAGGTVPDRSPDENTMNIASFFDLDGDGAVEYEIWLNLGPNGWGASYYENEAKLAYHGEDSFVEVAPEGDEVVARFALLHLDRADSFRWSIASEWGPYAAIGTDAMVRDQAPDAGAAKQFPS